MLRTLLGRVAVGRLIFIAGLALLAGWVNYFWPLQRPVDAWDYSPLLLILPILGIGAKVLKLHAPILNQLGRSYKRDLAIAAAVGILIELTLTVFFQIAPSDLDGAEISSALQRIQNTGYPIALTLYHHLRPHMGWTWARTSASFGALGVLAAFWASGIFTLFLILRFLRRANRKMAPA